MITSTVRQGPQNSNAWAQLSSIYDDGVVVPAPGIRYVRMPTWIDIRDLGCLGRVLAVARAFVSIEWICGLRLVHATIGTRDRDRQIVKRLFRHLDSRRTELEFC